jgi:hypothetical protein
MHERFLMLNIFFHWGAAVYNLETVPTCGKNSYAAPAPTLEEAKILE